METEFFDDNCVELRFDEAFATITINRDGGNRIDFGMRRALLDAIRAVADSGSRVLIVTAEGEDFCLGGDASEWAGIPSHELEPRIAVYATALRELERLPIPTMAIVQGRCRGGGFELALSCDFICASQSADFAFPEAQLGIITLQGGVLLLSERIGRTRALELTTLSEPVSASTLFGWNLVNWVADDASLMVEGERIARRLADSPQPAFATTKSLLRLAQIGGSWAAREQLYPLSMPLFDSPDVQAALAQARTRIE